MGFWEKFSKRERKEKTKTQLENCDKENLLEPKVRYEDIPGTLDLGWYFPEGKEEFQMSKVSEKDRATHLYVVGATGTGKTKFLEFLIWQDIEQGKGFGVIDPHGDLIEDIKGFLVSRYDKDQDKKELSERVVLVDPTDPDFTVTFNPLDKLPNVSVAEEANELIGSFKKIWSNSWGVRMEDLMRNSLIALGQASLTLAELPQFLTRKAFRKAVLEKNNHPVVQDYFKRFNTLTNRAQISWTEPVMNKINAFFSDERIRQMFSYPKSSFNLREIMDQGKILLIKLDKGKLKDSADLLSSLLMAKIQMAAFSRSDISQSKRVPFYLYIDEFQNFASESFSTVLSEARKYGLSLIMAHQTLSQVSTQLRSLILGNTGIQIYFRLNRQDASLLAKEGFEYSGYEVKRMRDVHPSYWSLGEEWEHKIEELQNLPLRYCYIKHNIQGGMIPIRTVEIEPIWEVLEMDEAKYERYVKSLPFGREYSFERKEIEKELREREKNLFEERSIKEEDKAFLELIIKEPEKTVSEVYKSLNVSIWKGTKIRDSLKEKGLIEEIETRLGKRGRLAKFFIPSMKAFDLLGERAPKGRGGSIHRHIQKLIKEEAISKGYKAKCEKELSNEGIVDVHIEKGKERIAIEVSITSTSDREIANISKCLDGGYDRIFCLFLDEKTMERTKGKIGEFFSGDGLSKVSLLPLKKLGSFL